MTLLTFIIYLLIGFFAGVCSGLFGIGGGVIIVPALSILFAQFYFPQEFIMQLAMGTSLATMSVITFMSAVSHHRLGYFSHKLILKIIPGMIAGAITGVVVADSLPTRFMQSLFVLFLIGVAISVLLRKKPPLNPGVPVLLSWPVLFVLCYGIGVMAGGLGISGGVLLTPLLLFCHFSFAQATVTTVACTFPTVMVGAVAAVMVGSNKVGLPPHALGFVYWPAVGCIGLTALLGAPLGAYLHHRLPERLLKPVFAILLLLTAWKMGVALK